MSKSLKSAILNQQVVSIFVDGETVSGTYTIRDGWITVTSHVGTKQVDCRLPPDLVARLLLRELAADGKAKSGSGQ